MSGKYATGADMWQEYKDLYGDAEARGICNRYLDLQVRATDPGELQFCRELYSAMQNDPLIKPAMTDNKRESVLAALGRAKQSGTRYEAGADRPKKPPGMEI